MRRHDKQAPRLPKELLDQIGEVHHGRAHSAPGRQTSRKERRKEDRAQKKQRRQPQVQARNSTAQYGQQNLTKSDSDNETSSDDDASIPKFTATHLRQEAGKKQLIPTQGRLSIDKVDPPLSFANNSVHISRAVKDKLAQDDVDIARLEKKLGLKGKKLPKSFEDDGLDIILDGLDEFDEGVYGVGSKRQLSKDEDWFAKKRQKSHGQGFLESSMAEDSEDTASSTEDSDLVGNDDLDSPKSNTKDDTTENFEGFCSDASVDVKRSKTRENPYAPPMIPGSISEAKYQPPYLRNAPSSDDLSRLRRQLQGLLNRLSEANILTIIRDIEKIYQENPRQHVSSTLIDLLIALLSDKAVLFDTFVILHAGFIAALYKVIGTDFGAQAVERIVFDFNAFYNESVSAEVVSKEATNLMSLIATLYSFQVIGSNLVFDYIRLLLAKFSDMNTELLLRIVKISGPQLRQDDPSSLKEIVLLLQRSVETHEGKLSVRTQFMIETINNLKNNRMKSGVFSTASISEHTTRMKKTLGSLSTRSIKATEPLRIGLDDILSTEKRGKWWLVGASWRNDDVVQTKERSKALQKEETTESTDFGNTDGAVDLLKLANEQRMNTDIRRAIFVTLMSAADYKDAHIRLLKLRLKKSQELEIPRVLIHCAGCEQTYNPYYTLIARKLCSDRKLRMAFQFSLWDIFKQCGESDSEGSRIGEDYEGSTFDARKLVNLGRMFGILIVEGGLPLTALKTLQFTYLRPKTKTFVEVLLVTAILHSQRKSQTRRDENSLLDFFKPVTQIPELARGLQYFIRKVVAKARITETVEDRETVRWGCKKVMLIFNDAALSEREE